MSCRKEVLAVGTALLLAPSAMAANPTEPPPATPDSAAPTAAKPDDWEPPHYDKGFVLASSTDPDRMPFRLVLNHVSQFKYTNSLAVHHTYVTHLGEVREVLRRNDIQLTRDVFYFSGFVFDRRLDYN